jgi:predicted  nucleic acid-binding Zn-ribbon protein
MDWLTRAGITNAQHAAHRARDEADAVAEALATTRKEVAELRREVLRLVGRVQELEARR